MIGGMSQAKATPAKSKKSTVRHTRAIQRDRSKRPNTAPPDELIEQRLDELVRPAVYTQANVYHAMGLRERTLTLPIMVAFVYQSDLATIGVSPRGSACPQSRRSPLDRSRGCFASSDVVASANLPSPIV